jgi:hypothetical protein
LRKKNLRWFGVLPLMAAVCAVGERAESSLRIARPDFRSGGPRPAAVSQRDAGKAYGRLPLSFEANRGQTDAHVKFLSRGSGYVLFLTPREAVLRLLKPRSQRLAFGRQRAARAEPAEKANATILRMRLLAANPSPQVVGLDALPGKSHYFIGNDPEKWRRNIPHYARVRFCEVYPGIDLIYYGRQGQLEYDFVVSPGADPSAIRLALDGPDKLILDDEGNVVLHMEGGDIIQCAPTVYEKGDGARPEIRGRWVLLGKRELRFQVASYDPHRQLVIDPVLTYSTYLGGSLWDEAMAIAVDASGNAYVAGYTESDDFPTAGPMQLPHATDYDVFVTKLSQSGSALIYSTYLGGCQDCTHSSDDEAYGIAVDSSGNAYVSGYTESDDFPVTPGAFATNNGGLRDAFLTKLYPAGDGLVFSTYLGGFWDDWASGIAVDASNNVYVAGETRSPDFPTAPLYPYCVPGTCPFQNHIAGEYGDRDAFVTKFNAVGSGLLFSTYLGGGYDDGASDIALDAAGNAYVTGNTRSPNFPTTPGAFDTTIGGVIDGFVTKLSVLGSQLIYSTYLGGGSSPIVAGHDDYPRAIAVDGSGSAYVTGETYSNDFPTRSAFDASFNGGEDAFVTKLSADGRELAYSTYLGGEESDAGEDIAVDTSGCAYVAGWTSSADFPVASPIQELLDGRIQYPHYSDVFVTKLSPSGFRLLYSTYLGGGGSDYGNAIAVDASGNAYVTGRTSSTDFPLTPGRLCIVGVTCPFQSSNTGSYDCFVSKIRDIPVAFEILDIRPWGNNLDITWRAEPFRTYNVLTKERIGAASWERVATDIVPTSDRGSWTDSGVRAAASKFYRIVRVQ